MAVKLVFLQALSSLHPGTGQGVGAIDLPVARERATNLPFVQGSSIKGALKADLGPSPDSDRIFGTEKAAGELQVSDARLLLLPIRCLGATFVWTTSPYVLRRLQRDAAAAGLSGLPDAVPDLDDGAAAAPSQDALVDIAGAKRLVLEDLDFTCRTDGAAWSNWLANQLFPAEPGWRAEFARRFAVIDDKSFAFLAEFATEVNAHIRIDDKTGVVETGALWYEETLPAETILVSLFRLSKLAGRAAQGDESTLLDGILASPAGPRALQLGGNATTGQGLVRLVPGGLA